MKDGSYNNTNINKQLSPAQNTPALQAIDFPKRKFKLSVGNGQYTVFTRIIAGGEYFLFFALKGGDYSREGDYLREAII